MSLLFSSYEVIAPFSPWVNRGVVARNTRAGKLTRIFFKQIAEEGIEHCRGGKINK